MFKTERKLRACCSSVVSQVKRWAQKIKRDTIRIAKVVGHQEGKEVVFLHGDYMCGLCVPGLTRYRLKGLNRPPVALSVISSMVTVLWGSLRRSPDGLRSPVTESNPRLLTNGYYIWTEDSFSATEDGNITLSPSQTRVLYKENLVKVSRRVRSRISTLAHLSIIHSFTHWVIQHCL